MSITYDDLLSRLRKNLGKTTSKSGARLELPEPNVIWVGNKTIFRNFLEYPKMLRRDPNKILIYLAKELATAASLDDERAIFIGRRDPQSFSVLLKRFLQENVLCPVCESPDTHLEKSKRLQFIVCEACGARSSAKTAG